MLVYHIEFSISPIASRCVYTLHFWTYIWIHVVQQLLYGNHIRQIPTLCPSLFTTGWISGRLMSYIAWSRAQPSKAWITNQFSEPQIEYPLGGSSKKGSHVYFLLTVAMVLLLWHQIALLWHQFTIVASKHLYQTIVLSRKLATGSIHDYFFRYCPLVGILFEVLRISYITAVAS